MGFDAGVMTATCAPANAGAKTETNAATSVSIFIGASLIHCLARFVAIWHIIMPWHGMGTGTGETEKIL
jgi:hypothetical protein